MMSNKQPKATYGTYNQYTNISSTGRKTMEKYNLVDTGVWQINGEDPNCDLAGHHSQPYLGTFTGTFEDAIHHALLTSGFIQWGGGGDITKISDVKDDVVKFLEEGERIMNELEATVTLTENQVKMIIAEHLSKRDNIKSPVASDDVTFDVGLEYEDRVGGSSHGIFKGCNVKINI